MTTTHLPCNVFQTKQCGSKTHACLPDITCLSGALSQGAPGDRECISRETGMDDGAALDAGGGRCGCLPCKSAPQESPLDGLDIVYHAVENVRHTAA